MNNGGDQLARGAVSAQFKPANVSEEEWAKIFGEAEAKLNAMSDEEKQAIIDEERERMKTLEANKPVVAQVRIRAVQDRIIVRRVESETVTTAGLYLADESVEKPAEGIVIATGPGKYINGQLIKTDIQVGERVVFGKFSGAAVKIGLDDALRVYGRRILFFVKESPIAVETPEVQEPINGPISVETKEKQKGKEKQNEHFIRSNHQRRKGI